MRAADPRGAKPVDASPATSPVAAKPVEARTVAATPVEARPVAAKPVAIAPKPPTDAAERSAGSAGTSSPASPGRASTLAIENVRTAWNEVVERTRDRSVGKAAQLMHAEPVSIESGTITIAFADDFARGVWQDRQRPELERDLSSVLGTEIRVRCVRQTSKPPTPATDDPMLRAALETFRRPERILEVE